MWATISDLFPPGSDQFEKEARIASAYIAVFQGSPTQQDQQIVLADLMASSGFAQVQGGGTQSDELNYREGKRALFAKVYAYLTLSSSDISALHNAARREAAQTIE